MSYNNNGDIMYIKLKEKRIEKKLTIYDMANMLNITPAYYYLLENGKRKLYYDMAIKIAYIFNMNPDYIFYTK